MARVLNLTPHVLHIYSDGPDPVLTIPSDGELRLLSTVPLEGFADVSVFPLCYQRPGQQDQVTIPVVHAQVFTGLDTKSPGHEHLWKLARGDCIIVSMPVAQWLVTHASASPFRVYSPGTGPSSVVRFEDGERKGQIKGVKALEYHSGYKPPRPVAF
jgi:hypothetical protein